MSLDIEYKAVVSSTAFTEVDTVTLTIKNPKANNFGSGDSDDWIFVTHDDPSTISTWASSNVTVTSNGGGAWTSVNNISSLTLKWPTQPTWIVFAENNGYNATWYMKLPISSTFDTIGTNFIGSTAQTWPSAYKNRILHNIDGDMSTIKNAFGIYTAKVSNIPFDGIHINTPNYIVNHYTDDGDIASGIKFDLEFYSVDNATHSDSDIVKFTYSGNSNNNFGGGDNNDWLFLTNQNPSTTTVWNSDAYIYDTSGSTAWVWLTPTNTKIELQWPTQPIWIVFAPNNGWDITWYMKLPISETFRTIGTNFIGSTAQTWPSAYMTNIKSTISGDINKAYTDTQLLDLGFSTTDVFPLFYSINPSQLGQDVDGEAAYDYSGNSVAISSNGKVMAIGAYYNNNQTGHVRVYRLTDTDSWEQIGNDLDGSAVGNEMGYSVSLSHDGNTLAVGERYYSGGSLTYNGSVSIYVLTDEQYTIRHQIFGNKASGYFGTSVSLSSTGNMVAIGALDYYGNGYVEVYDLTSTAYTLNGERISYNGQHSQNSQFGYSVSLADDGKTLAIGSNHYNVSSYEGAVLIYRKEADNWNLMFSDFGSSDDYLGTQVSIAGNGSWVATGAPNNSNGHVKIYKLESSTWSVFDTLIGSNDGDKFGTSVSFDTTGTMLIIGSYYANPSYTGEILVYRINNKGTEFQFETIIHGENTWDEAGISVALSSDATTVAIGAWKNDGNDNTITDSGHVRTYRLNQTEILKSDIVNILTKAEIQNFDSRLQYEIINFLLNDSVSLKMKGFTAIELLNLNFSISQLHDNYYTILDFQNAGKSTTELLDAGFLNHQVYKDLFILEPLQLGENISPEKAGDEHGSAVAMSTDGNVIATGAWYNDGTNSNGNTMTDSGHVRIFKFN
jgi:hypothetical protein